MTKVQVTALMAAALLWAGPAAAGEWPEWRGTGYRGVSDEVGLVDDWSPDGKNRVWHADFIGRSTPVVLDGQVCVIGRDGEGIERQEVVACYDAEDGSKRWEHRHNVYNTTVPFNRLGWASLVADPETGYVYAHGAAGQLICFDHDGEIVWSHFLAEDFGRLSGYGGRTQTPLVDGEQLILTFVSSGWGDQAAPRHRYFSFDKRTGEVLWISTPGGMPFDMNTQSAPVVAEIDGQRLLVAGNADGWVYAVESGTGEKVWGFQLSRRGLNSTVLVVGDTVYAGHSEENIDDPVMGRLVAFRASGTGDITQSAELWRINELSIGFPSPAYLDGHLYVVDNSANLYDIDGASGEIRWQYSVGTVGKASPVLADGKIYVPETNGRFHILKPREARPEPVEGRVVEGPDSLSMVELTVPDGRYAEIYGSPAIAYGRIYLATEGGLYCIGDESRKIRVAAPKRAKAPRKAKRAKGTPAQVRVIPAEVLVRPGEELSFEAYGFDAAGNPLGLVRADWSLKGISGTIDGNGRFRAGSERGFEAGAVSATVGDVQDAARVRVIAPLPWAEDFSGHETGSIPSHWIGAKGKFVVQEKDGDRVLAKLHRERGLLRNALYMGPSIWNNYTIEADLMGGQVKRRRSDLGLLAGGYTLDLLGNHQRIQVRSWTSEERMAQQVDFPWEMGVWYRAKMRVETGADRAVIKGKVWKKSDAEPAEWTIVVEDPLPIAGGSPGLIGYSPVDIYYDNIKVTVNE